ncbi:hypothetical protein, partial [Vibrio parahaemolyticus]|uniref:hypothetical protein n=1 Tax=Vibrio parahaemolyticus TaxID=670 RepID=UPI002110F270
RKKIAKTPDLKKNHKHHNFPRFNVKPKFVNFKSKIGDKEQRQKRRATKQIKQKKKESARLREKKEINKECKASLIRR